MGKPIKQTFICKHWFTLVLVQIGYFICQKVLLQEQVLNQINVFSSLSSSSDGGVSNILFSASVLIKPK